ncbi:MAG: hypothetical protein Q8896_11490 [Bacteroidota bacterium]|nr:hypothetical protein [Bacteroidota bacterium]
MRMQRAAYSFVACILLLCLGLLVSTETLTAQTHKKKKKKKPKHSVAIVPPSNFVPTMTGNPGTVKYYFFPNRVGTTWTLRTIQVLFDHEGKIARADTLFTESQVIDSDRMSLQRLPLMVTSDTSYKSTGIGVRSESIYYVDDSVAMTIFNNSVTSEDNRIFLVAPVTLLNSWHEKFGDSLVTKIAGFADSLVTPIGRFDSVLITLTLKDNTDLRKYFVPGRGIVKTIFRSPGPGGRGLVIVTTEMIAFKPP